VREVAEQFAEQASIVLHLEPAIEGVWDRDRLGQVVTNLLGNAVKYGQGKPIEVAAGTRDGEAFVRVTDRGIGIAADKLKKIFEPFERAVLNRQYSGFGLGLWIAHEIVEKSGGRIEVESRPGEGSTFTVRVPILRGEIGEAHGGG
jgi:signal transduction histidine kinase